jgi:hypothetical protein
LPDIAQAAITERLDLRDHGLSIFRMMAAAEAADILTIVS